MAPITFGIVGGGWRAEFFLRIAAALPGRYRIAGMHVRDAEKGRRLEAAFGVKTVRTFDEAFALRELRFVLVCVPRAVCPDYLRLLSDRGMPALSETPPAAALDGLIALNELAARGAKIQVAEQYQFQPQHAARLAIARSGRLGTVSEAQVSAAHGYHGISLVRLLLDAGFADATIRARKFVSPIVAGPNRAGPPAAEKIAQSTQVIAELDFGDRLGIFDFAGDQYFSWIRSNRVLVRGERGEINGEEIRYLQDFRTPVQLHLLRVNAGENGNLEGYYLKGIQAGDEWVYRNVLAPGRLTDDELAIATCLDKMAAYAAGGPSFYSLAEASQDHYLSLLIDQAVESGEKVRSERQPWCC